MSTLRISLLGGLHLTQDGQTLPTPSPQKLVSLLAYLLLHRQRPSDRQRLAGLLWPEAESAEARANLRRHLHLLWEALPDGEWLLTDRETVQWNPGEDFWLDVDAFTHCAAQPAGVDPLQSFETCLELYQGDLLPELYDDWLIAERQRLSALYLEVLKTASETQKGRGSYAEALRYARQRLSHDPLDEEAHREVMRLYTLAGDRPAALRQFAECQERLRRELDVAPMPATLELHRQIVDGSLPAGPDAPPVLPAPNPQTAPAPPRRLSSRSRLLLALTVVPLAVLAVLLVYASGRRTAAPITLELSGPAAAQDTWITIDYPDDLYWPDDPDKTPHSRYSRAHLQYFAPLPKDRILIQFKLDKLPAGIEIERALLEIHLETWIEPEATDIFTQALPAQVSLFQIMRPWQADQATFNRPWAQPGLGAGVDYAAQPLDVQPVDGTAWYSFDVTAAVQEWLRRPAANYGLALFITAAAQDKAHYWVDLTDQPAPSLRPVLRITYRKK